MQIKILSPLWGHEHLPLLQFLEKIKEAGYDGLETWLPPGEADRKLLIDYLQKNDMLLVVHQHEAAGKDFDDFKTSFEENLLACAAAEPLLINSHTGRDYFSFEQNLALLNIASEVGAKTGITVAHETHRGRFGYCPQMMPGFFTSDINFSITADLSHWVCVTESMLENFEPILKETINRTRHFHARVGFEEGPQVPHPAAPEWDYALQKFLGWWDEIVDVNKRNGQAKLTVTTEFGPQPYMPSVPFANTPVGNQFEINLYMKDLLQQRYAALA